MARNKKNSSKRRSNKKYSKKNRRSNKIKGGSCGCQFKGGNFQPAYTNTHNAYPLANIGKDPTSPNMQIAGRMLNGGSGNYRRKRSRKMRGGLGFTDFLIGSTSSPLLSSGTTMGSGIDANVASGLGNINPSVLDQPANNLQYTLV
jgi:hypothetical protein